MGDRIAYQNKDIMSKIFAEQMGNKSLEVYGVKVPRIVRVLKTDLPLVEANERRIDELFLLEDGSIAIIDYESEYRQENKIKYLSYITRVLAKLQAEGRLPVKIRMIVIYTADVEPRTTQPKLDAGCLQLSLEEAFLTGLDSAKIISHLTAKIMKGEKLTDEELMQYIIAPLTRKGKEDKISCITSMIDLSDHMKDDSQKRFVLSGMLVFGDKVVTADDRKRIWRRMFMTQIGMMFIEEQERAVREAVLENTKEVTKEVSTRTALNLMQQGIDFQVIAKSVDLPEADLRKLYDSVKNS